MITADKLRIYARHKGDVDMFGRVGDPQEKTLMDDRDFYLIQALLQDANVLDRNLGSEQRNADALDRLRSSCSSEDVIAQIRKLAEKL